jgi:hypothetical protein
VTENGRRNNMRSTTLPNQETALTGSIVRRGIRQDSEAIEILFRQFVPNQEPIVFASYFGLRGIWHIGSHSFACLTNRRVASLQIGWLGQVLYHDAYLEECSAIGIRQPSLLLFYLSGLIFVGATFGFGLLILPVFVRAYYRIVKSGLVVYVRGVEDVSVFSNRSRIIYLNRLVRMLMSERESRIRYLFSSATAIEADSGETQKESRVNHVESSMTERSIQKTI